jgi:hypothetical protein
MLKLRLHGGRGGGTGQGSRPRAPVGKPPTPLVGLPLLIPVSGRDCPFTPWGVRRLRCWFFTFTCSVFLLKPTGVVSLHAVQSGLFRHFSLVSTARPSRASAASSPLTGPSSSIRMASFMVPPARRSRAAAARMDGMAGGLPQVARVRRWWLVMGREGVGVGQLAADIAPALPALGAAAHPGQDADVA